MNRRDPTASETIVVPGRNPVLEVIRAGWPVREVLTSVARADERIQRVIEACSARGIPVRSATADELSRLAGKAHHQGIVALCGPVSYADLEEGFRRAERAGEPPFFALLDSIEDPRNLGAILRCADAAGVHGVVIPKHRATGLTPAVAKASAGAFAHVPVIRVTNLVRAAVELRERGLWLVAAAPEGGQELWRSRLTGPVAVVIGGEDKGIRRLLLETCDFSVRIPMFGRVPSLNASVAAALLFYEVRRQRTMQSP
jgi:23S rRNA (guanosine2251-2'-O)-methyltransferase